MELNLDFKNASSILVNKMESWYELLIKSLPNMAVAILVLAGFIVLAMLVRRITDKLMIKISGNRAITNLAKSLAYVITVLAGLFIALEILNLEKNGNINSSRCRSLRFSLRFCISRNSFKLCIWDFHST